jgi:hypothetical protein
MRVLKVCIDPHCDAVAHNCDKKETHCRDCNGGLVEINKETYIAKYINNYFQYDYSNDSGDVVSPAKMDYGLQMNIAL